MVNSDRRDRGDGGIKLEEPQISWVSVEPGSVMVGSDDRTILFGGMGPRHEVSIGYSFRISEQPVDYEKAILLVKENDMELVSDSEWQLAYSRGLIHGDEGSSEFLADSTQNYWGKPCDGRPLVKGRHSPNVIRRWKSGNAKTLTSFPKDKGSEFEGRIRLVVRDHSEWPVGPLTIPEFGNNSNILIEEILICMVVGIIPSFVWAYFNASPGYLRDGWLNLVLGGVFFGIFTVLFWRPKQPSWYIESGRLIQRKEKK